MCLPFEIVPEAVAERVKGSSGSSSRHTGRQLEVEYSYRRYECGPERLNPTCSLSAGHRPAR
jgi:hypothetical protein